MTCSDENLTTVGNLSRHDHDFTWIWSGPEEFLLNGVFMFALRVVRKGLRGKNATIGFCSVLYVSQGCLLGSGFLQIIYSLKMINYFTVWKKVWIKIQWFRIDFFLRIKRHGCEGIHTCSKKVYNTHFWRYVYKIDLTKAKTTGGNERALAIELTIKKEYRKKIRTERVAAILTITNYVRKIQEVFPFVFNTFAFRNSI